MVHACGTLLQENAREKKKNAWYLKPTLPLFLTDEPKLSGHARRILREHILTFMGEEDYV